MAAPITFGKYLLLDRINVGGMAEVFKAKTFGIEGFERIIAIKRILPNMADDEEFINMFVDEARIAVQLSHANIVQIYELGKIENQYYIAMEYVSGKDLRQILDRYRKKEKTLPVPAAAYITSKLCEGLDYAHRKTDPTGRPLNVIHRDVSPQNILVSFEGAVKITDFGIAKAEDRASKTQAGVLKGKFGYMSPEQVRGLEIDHRSDIFAVGILLYEMVTGKRLFIGESDFSTLERVRKAEVIPPSEHNPDLPPEFEQLVMRTLARERDERYQWASEMLDDLQTFLIDNNTIYNAKRLSSLLKDDYQSDIDAEMQRMEEYMRLPPPTAPATSEPVGAPPEAEAGDSTMVFESDFADLENAPTQIGESVSEHQVSRIEQMQTGSLVVQSKSAPARRPSGSQVRFKPENLRRATGGSPSKSLPVAVLSVAAAAFVALVCVLSYILFFAEGATGTLMVTSKPVNENVEIALNDDVVATSTPFFQEGIKAGSYRLEARAPGFQTKIYNVQIVDGADAIVAVKFDKREASEDGVARVTSDPPGASVYRNDEKIGITPFEITDLNTDEEVEVTVKLDGYHDVTLSESFTPGSLEVELRAALEEQAGTGTITVKSRPPGAIVYLDNERLGVTPYEVSDLDPEKSYDFELVKNGYRRTALTHRFNGDLTVTKSVVLEPVATDIKTSGTKTGGTKTGGGKGGGSKTARTGKGGKCGGSGGTLSAIVLGEANCAVKVGPKTTFRSPTFRTEVPVGRCTIVVNCPSGKSYTETRTLKTGDNGKLIVKQDMLK
ncbi:MAG: serine/threonine-protein kinase [Myxococcota bacterium]